METKIFSSEPESLKEAAQLIKEGKTVAFPTETVYGLGANALNEDAVSEIFKAKGRPSDNPLIVHIADFSEIYNIAEEVPEQAKLLAERFWPGPMTMILKKKPCIPDIVSAGLSTVGIRLPSNSVARSFIRSCGVPIAAPSANISGRPSPTSFEHTFEDMNGRAAGIIRGGDCSVGVESTVIDLSSNEPVILRPGGVSPEEIRELLGEVKISAELGNDKIAKAPGMKYKHYSPIAQVFIMSGNASDVFDFVKKRSKIRKTAVLAFDEFERMIPQGALFLSLGGKNDAAAAAHNLFARLRECDECGVAEVYAPEIPDNGLWRAVKNRLYKAAAGRLLRAESAKSVLFVCTGNTCRSPMAEVIFNSMHKNAVAASCGLYAQNGAPASENAVLAAKELGCDLSHHKAVQITGEMLENADLVLTMTAAHKASLPKSEKIMTIAEAAGLPNDEVSDPFGGSLEDYRNCIAKMKKLIESIDL